MQEYTLFVENGLRVKHSARLRLTIKSGQKVLEDRLVPAETIGGAITVAGYMYNGLSMSGGVSWRNPATGDSIKRPKYSIRCRPEDVLTEDMLCTCPTCS